MIYLASPYSHPDPTIVLTRYLLVMQATSALINARKFVYSPILHCHELARIHSLPTNFDFWQHYNINMIKRCDQFRVLKIPGWDESKGVKGESAVAAFLNLDRGFINEFGEDVL